LTKPVIAVIHGVALGGGLEFAMSCHIRFVSKEAKLGLPESNLGLIPGFAGSQRLSRYVGIAKSLEMMLSGESISGEEAVRIGLANQVYETDILFHKAHEFAKKISEKNPNAVKATLSLAYTSKTHEFYDGAISESQMFGTIFQSKDAKEGISAFLEKRKPTFTGK
jgi:enoyl-CoA hydratase